VAIEIDILERILKEIVYFNSVESNQIENNFWQLRLSLSQLKSQADRKIKREESYGATTTRNNRQRNLN
jgi:hypothetical protein